MARIIARVPRKIPWLPSDTLQLWIGSENVASLAASTPAGGTLATEVLAWGQGDAQDGYGWGQGEWGYGEWGNHNAPRAELEAEYTSADKCATLPVGVKVVDACGNVSVVFETTIQIHDPPQGARDVQVVANENTLEALVTWDESQDV